MSEEKKSPQKQSRSHFGALLLATVVSVIGACAMAASIVIQNSFMRRFPGNFTNFNASRPFNATRTFNAQLAVQRAPAAFGYTSWLNLLGLACLGVVAIILVILLFQNRSGATSRNITKAQQRLDKIT